MNNKAAPGSPGEDACTPGGAKRLWELQHLQYGRAGGMLIWTVLT
jgi:hypothetical protein